MSTISIYALCEPGTDEIRYVGQTSLPIHRRLASHMTPSELNNGTYKSNWLRKLVRSGQKPELYLLETVAASQLVEAETRWIAQCKAWGCRLTNATLGGEGCAGHKWSEEQKARYVNPFKGKPQRESHKQAIKEGWTEEVKDSARRKRQGKKMNISTSSPYIGVCHVKRCDRWEAYINKDGKRHRLGYHDTAEDAATAYNVKALELYGPTAKLNTFSHYS